MDRMLYISMTGAEQTLASQAANSHNLANVSTSGFRADLTAFMSLPVYGPGQPGRVYSGAESLGVDLTPGAIVTTGRDLDIAINGQGFLAVQAADGTEAYTRAGELKVNAAGLLEARDGSLVLGDGGPISLPAYQKLDIAADGTVTIQPLGQSATTLSAVGRLKLVNPDPATLTKGEDGLIRLTNGGSAAVDANVRLTPGAVESSNVNAVEAMVNMIELARTYEMQVKMMKAAEENDTASASLVSLA
jgi:flagellar basal-body rod protein FlgF